MRIIQCFNWPLRDIEKILVSVKEQGFDAIQINPIQPLKEDGAKEWWMSYQPIDFRIGNYYGTKEDLISLCEEASKYDLHIFADVVINHMGASNTDNLVPHDRVNPVLRGNPDYWKPQKRVSNWHNRQDVIHNCIDLPGLNVYHQDIEDMIINFLNELIDCGVHGFRFDAAKSIGLPSEGYNFWPNVCDRLKKSNLYLYGEVIFEEDQRVLNEYAKYMYVLGNYDASDRSRMVKYIENHDTFLSDNLLGYTRNVPTPLILKDYCQLIDYFDDTLFYIRPFDESWREESILKGHARTRRK